MSAEIIRIRGLVQGVGFRPTVARIARRLALDGWVKNDAEGVLVALAGPREVRDELLARLADELPPIARIEAIERHEVPSTNLARGFAIEGSAGGAPRTAVSPDAAMCAACSAEVRDPLARRFRYPFTNCTWCGPRFTIVEEVPYDRARTTMRAFPLCAECRVEYDDETDRRYHAEPIACHRCGPTARLSRADGRAFTWQSFSMLDEVDAVATLLQRGAIVAVKGLGSYHLCCLATDEAAVARLRARKHRPTKPFAMMARDLGIVERYARVGELERAAITSPQAPIVLLDRIESPGGAPIAPSVAPGQASLGFLLPTTPLHQLVLARLDVPIVCTSGNLTEEPPCAEPDEAHERLGAIADWFLDHDRPVAHRLDDSVVKIADGEARVVRRARGYTPAPLRLPEGFARAPRVLAMGAQWKGTVCIAQDGYAVLSQHLGDLDELRTFAEWTRSREVLAHLFRHEPAIVAVDSHPDYRSTRAGLELVASTGARLERVQHHHAHVAACMVEHGEPIDATVLGVALDGLGYGEAGELWGGELLVASYTRFERVGTMKPVALLGGDRAAEEPWRSLYAHLVAETRWSEIERDFGDVEVIRWLSDKPRGLLDQALASSDLAPRASSCGRLFDAVAAAVGLQRGVLEYEGQAAMALEQAVTPAALAEACAGELYPIGVPKLRGSGIPYVEPREMWRAVLGDLATDVGPALIAARFHVAIADAVARLATRLAHERSIATVALVGGVFQNRVLLELVAPRLRRDGLRVLVPREVPTNDGGISLGQAVVAAARSLAKESVPCA